MIFLNPFIDFLCHFRCKNWHNALFSDFFVTSIWKKNSTKIACKGRRNARNSTPLIHSKPWNRFSVESRTPAVEYALLCLTFCSQSHDVTPESSFLLRVCNDKKWIKVTKTELIKWIKKENVLFSEFVVNSNVFCEVSKLHDF